MVRKNSKKLENPFVYQGYEGPEYFFDRTEETENILSSLKNGRNITLISPRKIGKTGLIRHTFHQIGSGKNDIICIYDGGDVSLAKQTILPEYPVDDPLTAT
jgi:predicted AAA+ superfamily ATPase